MRPLEAEYRLLAAAWSNTKSTRGSNYSKEAVRAAAGVPCTAYSRKVKTHLTLI